MTHLYQLMQRLARSWALVCAGSKSSTQVQCCRMNERNIQQKQSEENATRIIRHETCSSCGARLNLPFPLIVDRSCDRCVITCLSFVPCAVGLHHHFRLADAPRHAGAARGTGCGLDNRRYCFAMNCQNKCAPRVYTHVHLCASVCILRFYDAGDSIRALSPAAFFRINAFVRKAISIKAIVHHFRLQL